MFRRIIPALIVLMLACPAALAGEGVNYEISSYVLYMTIQPDGAVRVREEIIYSNPSVYSGLTLNVDLDGADGIDDIEVWVDGEALDELPAGESYIGEALGYSVVRAAERAVIDIHASGDNDWRTFACAYTLGGLAKRYVDTAVLERALVPVERSAMLQNVAAIVTLPRSDGEVLAYVDGVVEDIPLLVQYDTVSIGPVDVAADEALSLQVVFPEDWLDEAAVLPQAVRDAIVRPREEAKAATERETNARRAEQYTAIAVYAALFGTALLLAMKRYGVRGRMKGGADESLLARYPAALSGYVAADEATPAMLAGTLAELRGAGALAVERDASGGIVLKRLGGADNLSRHQAVALDWIFERGDARSLSSLSAGNHYERAQAIEKGYAAYGSAVADDAYRAGLHWKNDTALILLSLLNILCGVVLGMVLLLVGRRMVVEAGCVALWMFFITKQLERVRRLTDEGERLQRAAASFGGMDERSRDELAARLPVTVALGGAARLDSEDGRLWQAVEEAIRSAHLQNASLRRRGKTA